MLIIGHRAISGVRIINLSLLQFELPCCRRVVCRTAKIAEHTVQHDARG